MELFAVRVMAVMVRPMAAAQSSARYKLSQYVAHAGEVPALGAVNRFRPSSVKGAK
jgi:hypothetical protein